MLACSEARTSLPWDERIPRRGSRLVVVFIALTAFGRLAHADSKADCDYLEISATNGKAPAIDPELQPLEKKLKKPPFSSWNTFHKLSTGHISLAQQKPEPLKLQKGAASLLLRDRGDKRLELTITIDGADGKRVLDTKQAVNVAPEWNIWGHSVGDDGHILALTCR
jgi:hypothetical protein